MPQICSWHSNMNPFHIYCEMWDIWFFFVIFYLPVEEEPESRHALLHLHPRKILVATDQVGVRQGEELLGKKTFGKMCVC